MELHGFVELARLRFGRGDDDGAQETLRRMSGLGPQHAACAGALQMLFAVKRSPNDPKVRSQAETWAKAHAPDPSIPLALGIGPYHRDTEYICNLAWARLQTALGHFEEAAAFLQPALALAGERGLLYRVAELSIALALLHEQQGRASTALQELEKALEIAEPCGYTRFFDDGPELDALLLKAMERKTRAAFVRKLLASFVRTPAGGSALQKKGQLSLAEPLSGRELEILQLLATSLTAAEIAARLFLSPFTLKSHTQNIYTKLGVHSRVEAINKARELELI
jgi:ATP/maltotriose-dependent transcriptional regulator MalT